MKNLCFEGLKKEVGEGGFIRAFHRRASLFEEFFARRAGSVGLVGFFPVAAVRGEEGGFFLIWDLPLDQKRHSGADEDDAAEDQELVPLPDDDGAEQLPAHLELKGDRDPLGEGEAHAGAPWEDHPDGLPHSEKEDRHADHLHDQDAVFYQKVKNSVDPIQKILHHILRSYGILRCQYTTDLPRGKGEKRFFSIFRFFFPKNRKREKGGEERREKR